MAYKETKNTGYGARLKNSFGGIATGFIMFLAATALLWWNEGRAVKTQKMLDEAQGAYVEMKDIQKVDPQYEGKLVYATGLATTNDSLADPILGVEDLALTMHRKVEYYQWVEHSRQEKRDKLGGGEETVTTYTYKKEWKGEPQESADFHDPQYKNSNYVLLNIDNATFTAANVTFGAYRLSNSQVAALPANQQLTPTIPIETMRQLDQNARQTYRSRHPEAASAAAGAPTTETNKNDTAAGASKNDSTAKAAGTQSGTATPPIEFVHAAGDNIYIGLSPGGSPAIGDVRITYTKAAPTNVSIMAQVSGNTFVNYKAKNGKSFSGIAVGTKSADEIIEGKQAASEMWTWVLRIFGVLLTIGGLKGIFAFLETILKVIPPLAGILGFGVRIVCSIVGFAWSLLIIALAWLFYRPLIGIALLAGAAALIFAFSQKGKALRERIASTKK